MNSTGINSAIHSFDFAAVIVAGGIGARFGASKPKQFCLLDGTPVLRRSVDVFASLRDCRQMVVVCHPEWLREAEAALQSVPGRDRITIVSGGEFRQDSCRIGLMSVRGEDETPVLIHDAARPWVTEKLVKTVVNAVLSGCDAVVPVMDPADSLVVQRNRVVIEYAERSSIAAVQTPQGFRLGMIRNVHQAAFLAGKRHFADDGAMALEAGHVLVAVPGIPENRKITVPEDL